MKNSTKLERWFKSFWPVFDDKILKGLKSTTSSLYLSIFDIPDYIIRDNKINELEKLYKIQSETVKK